MSARPWIALAAAAALVAAVAAACTQPHVRTQRRVLAREMPATLEAPTRWDGAVRTARIRVWADADYRAQRVRWKQAFGDELDYANQLLQPMLGLRLEADLRDWDRRAPGASLRETLAELAAHDPGDDVAWVFALTSALPLVSATMDELGVAEVLGGHVVLRGYNDLEERKAFARAFPDLEAAERDQVHDARRRHKQTVVLVHEIAHTLGAIHETDPAWIMHPAYRPEQASISDRNRELMLVALADRLRPAAARDPLATAEGLLAVLEGGDWGGWIAAEKEALIAYLHAEVQATRAGLTASPVPGPAYGQYARAQRLAAAGQLDDALAELEPIIAAYPGNAAIRQLACEIQLARGGPHDEAARATCAKASELAPGDPSPNVAIAAALAAAGDLAGARAQLVEAEGRIAGLREGVAEAWVEVATMYQAMGALTWAEDAIARSGLAEHPIATWAARTRARYGVPRDGARWKITAEDEGELVAAVRRVLDLVYADDVAEAERAAKAAEARWPGAPGLLAARCDLAMRRQQHAQARKLCARAIDAYDGAAWAHYLLGVLTLRDTGRKATAAGIASLRAAIAADPDLGQAWRALGKALARAKDQAGLDELRDAYRARFGRGLPE